MSGLEIVGVVLGVVPLIVAALEQYKSSKRLWDRFRKTALHINELIEALDENHALIEASLDSLLQKAVGAERVWVVNDTVVYGSGFTKKDITPDLQSFMGKLYKPYEKALLRCEQTLLRIVNKIDGLILGSKAPLQSLKEAIDAQPYSNGRYTFANRLRFCVKKDELDELIAALKESRQSLEDIARARVTKDVPLPTSSAKATGLTRFFDRIQGHASDLHSAICTA
ncbi:hypothetical protein G7Y79_00008g024590 [Physcia stellaris]|nr:hypothetical protein G7Y79_00008g024590 [Physcia stellaris]